MPYKIKMLLINEVERKCWIWVGIQALRRLTYSAKKHALLSIPASTSNDTNQRRPGTTVLRKLHGDSARSHFCSILYIVTKASDRPPEQQGRLSF